MSPRAMGIAAGAVLAVLAGLLFLGRGGHDSSAASLTIAARSTPAAATVAPPSAPKPAAGSKAGAGSRLIAPRGPYRDPFVPPADAVDGTEGAATANGQSGSGAPSTTAPQAVPSSPAPPQGAPADAGGGGPTPGQEPSAPASPGTAPATHAPPAPLSPGTPAPPASSASPVAVLRLVIPGHDPQTAVVGAQGLLPSLSNPLLAVVRVAPNRRQAVLLLGAGVHPEGEGEGDCSPRGERCRMLTLAVGDVQPLESTSRADRPVHYRLLLVDVR